MKKIIWTLLFISSVFVLVGCSQKDSQNFELNGKITTQTEDYTERTSTDINGNKVITKQYKDGNIETVIEESNRITKINKTPDGNISKMIEETTQDSNGNKIIKRIFDDGLLEKETYDGNKIIRTRKHSDGKIDKSIEENIEDGTRIVTFTDPDGKIQKYTEKDLGNRKKHSIIEKEKEDGTIERIEDFSEDLGNGINKVTQKFDDGKILEILTTNTNTKNQTETTTIYPDGKTEKTTEEFFPQKNGKIKIITTHPDGSKTEKIFDNSVAIGTPAIIQN